MLQPRRRFGLLPTRIAEDDASAACGPQLRTQRVRVRSALFRDPDDECRARAPACVQNQRQPLAQNGTELAAQPFVGGEDTAFGPVAGKLDAPRPPCRAGHESEAMARTLDHQLGELDAARAYR